MIPIGTSTLFARFFPLAHKRHWGFQNFLVLHELETISGHVWGFIFHDNWSLTVRMRDATEVLWQLTIGG